MNDRISAADFQVAEGTGDWRVTADERASAVFRTGSFTTGVQLVEAIGELAEAANHHPDVDLRYGTVVVRLTSHDVGGLSERDVALAVQVSRAARELDVPADPAAPTGLTIGIDVLDGRAVQPFWRAVLGYEPAVGSGSEEPAPALVDPAGHLPTVWFQQMDAPREQRNRVHLDVYVGPDVAAQRVADAVAAGGRLVTDEFAPDWWVLADAEGNEACVCTWPVER
ncbi:4a-hydroxytetrahydrobiopterin dehydratase [Isoptericola sp. CG 20/1183]|uniref:Putative pterin-4-alpha-carbinolamine dehydratase n=1 Tax=Isoptericola halotolerans TaxID=300560 RepID=A0ABX5ECD9_9MICO|nr:MULTISPECIES: VOC family protein [Isoptericola]PRZ05244.1 4a-hydroxytetrahydrobiopterin dehydratase [Isoptericola halotolerans]PRZ05982.1 4a-hydroxytetrahydrobiopterin dehydratase [Isoptericola sp. CG 20/1183]